MREAFLPAQGEVACAKVALAGDSGVTVDGIMLDGPVVLQAEHILARHERNVSGT